MTTKSLEKTCPKHEECLKLLKDEGVIPSYDLTKLPKIKPKTWTSTGKGHVRMRKAAYICKLCPEMRHNWVETLGASDVEEINAPLANRGGKVE